MSYYTSKHPGFFLYLALITLSVSVFLFTEANTAILGILSICWGGYIFMRSLTLYEVSEHNTPLTHHNASKQTNRQNAPLPHDLKRRLNGNDHFARGMQALCAVKLRSIIWLVLGVLYVTSYLFWNKQGLNASEAVEYISILFMIGGAFWAGQSYAYSTRASHIMMILLTSLLLLSVFYTTHFTANSLYSYIPDVSNNYAATALILLIAYSCIMLFYSLRNNAKNTGHALTGLSIIGFLALAYLSHERSIDMNALWISGWGLFSIFWIRTYKRSEKSYVLYQCQ